MLLLSSVLFIKKNNFLGIKERIFFMMVFSFISEALLTALFLYYKLLVDNGNTIISGIHGRYFIPIVPLYLISVERIFKTDHHWFTFITKIGIVATMIAGTAFTFSTLYIRYYLGSG